MVSQLLFGETFEIVEYSGDFVRIRITHDQYEGFIRKEQFLTLDEEEYSTICNQPPLYPSKPVSYITDELARLKYPILFGSNLAGLNGQKIEIAGRKFIYQDEVIKPQSGDIDHLISSAYTFLHAPYLWGGRSLFGVDCSGFTQVVYQIHGVFLPRDAYQQATCGMVIHMINEARRGDLAFFEDENQQIVHTGICLENGKIIHASGFVRIDSLDHHGIYNHEKIQYTHRLRLIRRVIHE